MTNTAMLKNVTIRNQGPAHARRIEANQNFGLLVYSRTVVIPAEAGTQAGLIWHDIECVCPCGFTHMRRTSRHRLLLADWVPAFAGMTGVSVAKCETIRSPVLLLMNSNKRLRIKTTPDWQVERPGSCGLTFL